MDPAEYRRRSRSMKFVTLALAQAALSAHSAFQGIILPGTPLPHLG